MALDQGEFDRAVRKVIEYFSEIEFSDKKAETERLQLLHDANRALGGGRTGFDLWRHFDNLQNSQLPPDVAVEVYNFKYYFRGQF